MNRRRAVKSILAYGFLSVSAVSLYEFLRLTRSPDVGYLLNKKNVIAQLAEVIIPRTDTPGAMDAKVEDYIVHALTKLVPRRTCNNFVDGLQELEKTAEMRYKKSLSACSDEQRKYLLNELGTTTELNIPGGNFLRKVNRKLRGDGFFDTLRGLTIFGYCTSEAGATMCLAYDHIPVNYLPCIPYSPGQRGWATK